MVKSHSRTHHISKAGLLVGIITILAVISGGYFVYAEMLLGTVGASSGISTCLYVGDVYSDSTQQLCSAREVFGFTGFQPFSGYTTVNGKNVTIYDSVTGVSKPVNRTAVLTTKITEGTMASATTSCIETLTLNGNILTTRNQTASFTSTPNLSTICSLARDGKVLVTQDLPQGNGSSTLVWSVVGKQTIKFTNGVVVQRPFSGVLGNLTITTLEYRTTTTGTDGAGTTDTTTTTTSTGTGTDGAGTTGETGTATGTNISMPSITSDPTDQIIGSSVNSASVSESVLSISTPVTDPEYVEKVSQVISSTLTSNTVSATIGGETIDVNVCQVGSCSYSPATSTSEATVNAVVTKADLAVYERDSQQILNQFEAKSISDLTPYSRCAYFLQC